MSQVDSRNSSAVKRARTDGGRREDDWTCPGCGNVNFSFRTTCNMRNCTQSRPADHSSKPAPKPMQLPQGYTSPAPYVGSGAPSSMYMGGPPPLYGSSMFNGPPMHGSSMPPPYDVPFSGAAAYHYNYANRIPAGSPFRPSPFSAPSPYSSGSMMGNGGMYGAPPMLDRYGLGLPMPMSLSMAPRPGFYPEEKTQKRAGEATRDNDWACPKCGNVNFSFRTVCNMRKCNTPKPGPQVYGSQMQAAPSPRPVKISKFEPNMPEGSWVCEKCSNINYPFRNKCNRQNCGSYKPSAINNAQPEAANADDQ